MATLTTLTLEAFYNAKFLNHTTAFARQPLCSTWKLSKCRDELKSSFKSVWLEKYQPRQVVRLQTSSSFKLSDGAHGLRWLWSWSRSLFSESKHSDEKLHIFVKKKEKTKHKYLWGYVGEAKQPHLVWRTAQSMMGRLAESNDREKHWCLRELHSRVPLFRFWLAQILIHDVSCTAAQLKKAISTSNRPHERWHTLTHTGAIQTSHLSSLEMVFLWEHSSCQEASSSLPTSFLSTAGENSSEKNKGGEWGAGQFARHTSWERH